MMRGAAAIVLANVLLCAASDAPSPCSNVFRQDAAGAPGAYTGVLALSSEYNLKGSWIRVVFDSKPTDLQTAFGESVGRPDGFLIKKPEFYVKPGVPFEVPVDVRYAAGGPAPRIVSVRLNGRKVCPPQPHVEISPCPGVFSYDEARNETGKWYGTITVESEYEISGIWLRIILDKKAEFIGSDFGEVITRGDTSYLLKNPDFVLMPGVPFKMPFYVKHSEKQEKPHVVEVRLNGRVICHKDESL